MSSILRRCVRWAVMAAAVLAAPVGLADNDDVRFQSTLPADGGQVDGYVLNERQYLGVRFENRQPWYITEAGGHVFQHQETGFGLFIAIVPLDAPDDLPAEIDLSDAVWSTRFQGPQLSADVGVPANFVLPPGWWALVLGGGGLFGSDGTGGMARDHIDVGFPSYIRMQAAPPNFTPRWEATTTEAKRFFIHGFVACIEETGDGDVDCAEDCFDGYDNDADGFYDCQDQDCWVNPSCCDSDGDGFLRADSVCGWGPDCDDLYPTGAVIHPGAPEVIADGIDQDCDGGDTCLGDFDRDGFAGSTYLHLSADLLCGNDPGEGLASDDCVDRGPDAAAIFPGAIEQVADGIDQDCDGWELCFVDEDGDGHGARRWRLVQGIDCASVAGVSASGDDCDDTGPEAALFHPGAVDIAADGIDHDCDGVDNCFLDLDGDGHGTPVVVPGASLSCTAGAGVAPVSDDCDDVGRGSFSIYPGAAERPGDGVDQDCDGLDACFLDRDGDGFGRDEVQLAGALVCAQVPGLSDRGDDCLDDGLGAADVYPGAREVAADGVDQDCNGADGCFFDRDRDGVGGPIVATIAGIVCQETPGYSNRNDDCVDIGLGAVTIYPGAEEVLGDGIDQDCDGSDLCWADLDGDGWGTRTPVVAGTLGCVGPGESLITGDCDDSAPLRHPGVPEVVADDADQDCDGVDLCFEDQDNDGWGSAVTVPHRPGERCGAGTQVADRAGDCDDTNGDVRPGAQELLYDGLDNDCDGLQPDDDDGDGYAWKGVGGADCDDRNALISPVAVELFNGVDDDCDGRVDEGTLGSDDDGDGFAELGGDCDDNDRRRHPAMEERCDGVDQDCDGAIDEGTLCSDDDGDGLSELAGDCNDGDPAVRPGRPEVAGNGVDDDCDGVLLADNLDVDGDGYLPPLDCDPDNAGVRPGAAERPNGVDDDCDGLVDEGTMIVDSDGDGFMPATGDCDDTEPTTAPYQPELIDGVDNDCDGEVDEGGPWTDVDGDGHFPPDDCDEADPLVHLGAPERDNGADDDCDGEIDEGVSDRDGDGWATEDGDCDDSNGWVAPGLEELCDGLDNDCNGLTDDACDGWAVWRPVGCATGGAGAPVWAALLTLAAVRRRRFFLTARAPTG